ncbi:TonB-dependent receptor domain-containing protein [Catenovulum maritimum]|uniref:TonB-dependent receptor n=1 Tax=Catenovulum maritimum TaxID=1513271 RepID=A0A0J8H224_9ALTE|nr:TonB-dependent receptor [Catenovulum maritimum]KMT67083.1 hypothetical protein XM47_00385 [Catenovulum maritimum]
MNDRFKLKALSSAIIAACISTPSFAAEDEAKDKEQTEVIEVTGFRGSLIKSINAKRFSDQVVDSIHAEDVGKSTDQNIADALSRITGVTVTETNGEGTRIAVRGANSSLNQISINGVALTSGGSGDAGELSSDQSVDLSAFSSDILSSIDVQKTAAADQDEGSLGANVVLRTVRPLNTRNNRKLLNGEVRYNQFNGNFNHRISGSITHKFLDETLGVVFTATDETQSTRRDQYNSNWDDRNVADNQIQAQYIRDSKTGEILSEMADSPFYQQPETEVQFLKPGSVEYRLNMDEQKRQTLTTGIQYLLGDETEFMLDLNYSKREQDIDNNRIQNQVYPGTRFNLNTDKQDEWHVLDTERNVLLKEFERKGRNKIYRQTSGVEDTTKVASLNITHNINDDLTASVLFGYSNTESQSKPNANVFLNGILQGNIVSNIPADTSDLPENHQDVIHELQPIGIDCTLSNICDITTTDALMDHVLRPGANPARDTAPNAGNVTDPSLYTFFNVSTNNDVTSDTAKSLFLDFDWLVDFAGVTKVEFGGKWSNRSKSLMSDRYSIGPGNVSDAESDIDSDIDFDDRAGVQQRVTYLDLLTDEAFPVDDFMDGIVSDSNQTSFLGGWGMVDPLKVFDLMQSGNIIPRDQLRFRSSPTNSRDIEQTNTAFYTKFNFEYLDSALTGNLGFRYIKTETDSTAYQELNYSGGRSSYDMYDLIYNKQLANPNLPICDYVLEDGLNYPDNDQNQFASNLPTSPCFDYHMVLDTEEMPAVEARGGQIYIHPDELMQDYYKLQVAYDTNGNVTDILRNDSFTTGARFAQTGNGGLWRDGSAWYDHTTNVSTLFDDGSGNLVTDPNAAVRFKKGSGGATHYNLLPSLTLNYAFSQDVIGRFGLSKTMARPRFDDLRPRKTLQEQTSGNSQGAFFNPNLKPLTSNNLDLSLEWYFSDTGMASVAFFYKDMKDFVQRTNQKYLALDAREYRNQKDENGEFFIPNVNDIEDLLIAPTPKPGTTLADEDWVETPATTGCLPVRTYVTVMGNALDLGCQTFDLETRINGRGTTTKGFELSYSQNFDFLPGVFSGLGAMVNYTFADSENEAEVNDAGEIQTPFPQPNTPRHSSNTTVFWEKDGIMLRLAHRYNSAQLVNESAFDGLGATWLDESDRVDFSATYRLNNKVTFTLQATNLTDEDRTTFMTSRNWVINGERLDEGNALTSNGDRSKIAQVIKTGRLFRMGVRVSF